MGIEIVIRYCLADRALAERIGHALGEAGHRVRWLPDTEPLPVRDDAPLTLLLWTANSVHSPALQRAAAALPQCLHVSVAGAAPPSGLPSGWRVDLGDGGAGWQPLFDAVQRAGRDDPFGAMPAASQSPGGNDGFLAGSGRIDIDIDTNHGFDGPSISDPMMPPPMSAEPQPAGAEPPEAPAAASPESPPESTPEPAPVLLAASAPRQCAAGSGFTACLVTYVEAARESALRRLEQFGEAGDRVVSDLAPDGDARWRIGAPVTVRLAGPHLSVTPAERRFDWNGRENAAAFAVTVAAAAPAGSVELCFAVDVAGVPMAFIPMRVLIGAVPTAPAVAALPPLPPTEVAAPRSVFVSYSSKDAATVTQRLSTLVRWSPGLDIFQDCLDLAPNEAFKPQLTAQIAARDRFVLFWSRHAAASPWVRWEYETARDGKGLAAILPMPLEDPAIAPPPAEFADAHWRDRFMLAGYALAKIREEVVKP